jgi:hypothetical protein
MPVKATGVLTPVALFAVVVVVAACGAGHRYPAPVEAPVAVEDDRFDDSDTPDAASGSPASDTLADEDAAAGGASRRIAIKARGLDAHRAARFVAEATGENVLVVGGSVAPLAFDIEVTQGGAALVEVARVAGLEARRLDKLTVVGPGGALARLGDRESMKAGEEIDLDFYLEPADELLRRLADVTRVDVSGAMGGRVTILAQLVGASALLEVLVALAGAGAAAHGPTQLPPGSALPAVVGFPPNPAWRACPSYRTYRVVFSCVPLDALDVVGVALSTGRDELALLVPRAGVQGDWRDEIIRRGVFVGQPRRASSGEERFWRVEAIDEHGVRLVLVQSLESGSPVAGVPEITLSLASTP